MARDVRSGRGTRAGEPGEASPTPAEPATASPDTGGARGFPPERQEHYPVAGGAVDAVDRRADEEELSASAHDPLGPAGYVEERDLTGGPAPSVAERTADPTHEPFIPVDLVVEGPEAGPVFVVLPPRAGEEEQGEERFPEVGMHTTEPSASRWLAPFTTTLHHTRDWMRDVGDALGSQDPRHARHALHAVLAALRDQLPAPEIADLAASLPLTLRGLMLEGWTGHPNKVDTRVGLLAAIERDLGHRTRIDPERALRAVLEVLRRRIPAGELADIEAVLPADLKWLMEPA